MVRAWPGFEGGDSARLEVLLGVGTSVVRVWLDTLRAMACRSTFSTLRTIQVPLGVLWRIRVLPGPCLGGMCVDGFI